MKTIGSYILGITLGLSLFSGLPAFGNSSSIPFDGELRISSEQNNNTVIISGSAAEALYSSMQVEQVYSHNGELGILTKTLKTNSCVKYVHASGYPRLSFRCEITLEL
jgi:hypothetical protein